MTDTIKPLIACVTTVPQSLSFLSGQLQYMLWGGFRIIVVSSPGSELEKLALSKKIPVFAVPMERRISPLKDMVSLYRLCCIFRKIRPDIVHAHTPKAGLLATLAAAIMMVRVRCFHIHGLVYLTSYGLKRRLLMLMDRLSCTVATKVICVSESIREQSILDNICSMEKSCVLHNGSICGVDTDRFSRDRYESKILRKSLGILPKDKVVGFVGRIVKDKGVVELFQAWKGLRRKYNNIHLIIVGAKECGDPVQEKILYEIESDEKIHCIGHVFNAAPYYAIMDVLAMPTHREGFGLVAIEASSMEVPVVASRVPGCVDSVINGSTGVLVPVGDSNALEDAISNYLDNESIRRLHGKQGRERVLKDFIPEDIWAAQLLQYRNLLEINKI